MDRMVLQLQGGCCEFSTESTEARPDGSCHVRPAGWTAFIRNPGRECLRAAAQCLGELGPAAPPRVVASLIAAVQSGPGNYDTGDGIIPVRDAAIEALGHTGDRRAVAVLIEALEHPKPLEPGPGAAGYFSKQIDGEVAALNALGSLGPVAAGAVPRIVPFLKHSVPGASAVRIAEAAARALAAIHDPSAIPPLIAALDRNDAAPRLAAALGAFGGAAAQALPTLIRLIENQPDAEGHQIIRDSIRSIGGTRAYAKLPQSYQEMMIDIAKLIQTAAKKYGVRLHELHVDGPGEQVAVGVPSNGRMIVRFARQEWLSLRVVKGNVVVQGGGTEESAEQYSGLTQLDERIARKFRVLAGFR
jgi:PBS lyase HEAT-like repeat